MACELPLPPCTCAAPCTATQTRTRTRTLIRCTCAAPCTATSSSTRGYATRTPRRRTRCGPARRPHRRPAHHRVAASLTHGCRLCHMWSQARRCSRCPATLSRRASPSACCLPWVCHRSWCTRSGATRSRSCNSPPQEEEGHARAPGGCSAAQGPCKVLPFFCPQLPPAFGSEK